MDNKRDDQVQGKCISAINLLFGSRSFCCSQRFYLQTHASEKEAEVQVLAARARAKVSVAILCF